MKHFYTVTAKTCKSPFIEVEYRDLLESEAKIVSNILTGGFNSVMCTNDTTGEIMFESYKSCDFYELIFTVSKCLQDVADIIGTK